MNKVRKQRLWIAAVTVTSTCIGVVVLLFALGSNLNHFYTPSELEAGQAQVDQMIRVGGLVKAGSVNREDGDSLKVTFQITDQAQEVLVSYDGILPDLFREGQGIVVTGRFDGRGVVASEVLAKHDETYMPPEAFEAIKAAGHPEGTLNSYQNGSSYDKGAVSSGEQVDQ